MRAEVTRLMVMPFIPFAKSLADGAGTEGGRRPTVVPAPSAASPELVDRPHRRTFTAAYKLGILRQIDEAGPGGIGAILRREGLYSSLLTDWRRQRDAGAREALKAVKRGPKVAEPNPLTAEHAQLQRYYKRLTLRLQRAEAIIEIQKNERGLTPPVGVETICAILATEGSGRLLFGGA